MQKVYYSFTLRIVHITRRRLYHLKFIIRYLYSRFIQAKLACTNKSVEYEALHSGFVLAKTMGIRNLGISFGYTLSHIAVLGEK